MKVCNGNYGDTRWRGINQVLMTNGYIVSSSAKMNEYYLYESNDDQKQYTMCHEMGHGFGLPHSDESFTNRDLGNCMDYTNRPGVNKQPDTSNYEFLADLYGTVDGSNWTSSIETIPPYQEGQTQVPTQDMQTMPPMTTQPYSDEPMHEPPDHEKGNGPPHRSLRTVHASNLYPDTSLPDWLAAAWKTAASHIEHSDSVGASKVNGWRMLHQTMYGELHEINLGSGYTLRSYKLLASNDDA
jgi:hypothetical protein